MKALFIRLGGMGAVMMGISLITFTLSYLSPGDKAMAIAFARYPQQRGFDPEILDSIRAEFHLNDSFGEQYLRWLGDMLRGDFGLSYGSRVPVWNIFVDNLGETLTLALSAMTLGLIGAFVLASLAVRHPGGVMDRAAVILSSIGAAMPNFWLALLLILLFAVKLDWLPAYGTGSWAHLALPALTLAFWVMASQTRMLRSFMLDAYAQPFIETLRLRGIPGREIFAKHVLRHAMLPGLTMIGLDFASLIEGAVIVEIVFARSGLGSLLAGSVLARDLPVVMFLVVFFAFTYVVINTAIDVVQSLSDPRSRSHGGAS